MKGLVLLVNYLVHLYLSDPVPLVRLGNLMGDFVKGRLDDLPYPADIVRGLYQHRVVDSLSHHSPVVRASKQRIDERFGYFRGILIDVFYDHFLASNWQQHATGSLEDFARETYRLLNDYEHLLPEGLKAVAPRMIQYNWLASYRDVDVMRRALIRISQRISRENPLAEGYDELLAHYDELEEDCARFLAEAKAHLAGEAP